MKNKENLVTKKKNQAEGRFRETILGAKENVTS